MKLSRADITGVAVLALLIACVLGWQARDNDDRPLALPPGMAVTHKQLTLTFAELTQYARYNHGCDDCREHLIDDAKDVIGLMWRQDQARRQPTRQELADVRSGVSRARTSRHLSAAFRDKLIGWLATSNTTVGRQPKPPEISDQELQAYWNDVKGNYQKPETRIVRRLRFGAAPAAARVARQLNAKVVNVPELLRDAGLPPETWVSQNLTVGVKRSDLPAGLRDAVFAAAADNRWRGPVRAAGGWWIYAVEHVDPVKNIPFSQVKQALRRQAATDKSRKLAAKRRPLIDDRRAQTYCHAALHATGMCRGS